MQSLVTLVLCMSLLRPNGRFIPLCPLFRYTMSDFSLEMVSIPRIQLDQILIQMQRAEGICRKARPASRHPDKAELMAEPTTFYSGASGYAGATMRDVIQQIESHLPLE